MKKGYSTFCPSCYADCGKRTITDAQGKFAFKGLSPDLWFQLLVVGKGYEPTFVNKVDVDAFLITLYPENEAKAAAGPTAAKPRPC